MVSQFVKHSASVGVVVGLFMFSLPIVPADARGRLFRRSGFVNERSYRDCTADLLRTGLSPEQTAAGCSEALYPRDLGRCVTRISRGQENFALNALFACRQVRRPVELATCFVEIRDELDDTTATDVLDNCRRSLLPARYSDCVVGISRQTELASTVVLNACISGADYPREFAPTLLPVGAPAIETSPSTAPPAATPPVESPSPGPEASPQTTTPEASPQPSPSP